MTSRWADALSKGPLSPEVRNVFAEDLEYAPTHGQWRDQYGKGTITKGCSACRVSSRTGRHREASRLRSYQHQTKRKNSRVSDSQKLILKQAAYRYAATPTRMGTQETKVITGHNRSYYYILRPYPRPTLPCIPLPPALSLSPKNYYPPTDHFFERQRPPTRCSHGTAKFIYRYRCTTDVPGRDLATRSVQSRGAANRKKDLVHLQPSRWQYDSKMIPAFMAWAPFARTARNLGIVDIWGLRYRLPAGCTPPSGIPRSNEPSIASESLQPDEARDPTKRHRHWSFGAGCVGSTGLEQNEMEGPFYANIKDSISKEISELEALVSLSARFNYGFLCYDIDEDGWLECCHFLDIILPSNRTPSRANRERHDRHPLALSRVSKLET
ncbi:hypothetical protein IW262DRAFT_1510277 [Armillaria fumosa]|nr:hypothetical protein IW262DRAFT_1510277 [Armillaria fumosa]